MKKRILFVDDEALVLQGLQRTLRSMRDEWDMEFVANGETALARMAQGPFDVVISDMLMPGLNGAELLGEVMARYPKTVRLILSGHADRELILKCVGSAHQYLSKPCDAETLKATVTRATSLESSSQNDQLMALVARVEILPSLPALYTDIMECLRSPDFSMEDVGAIIAKDIAMTAKVLKLVNSAFFGLGRKISSPAEAAAYLGADLLKSLILSANVFAQFQSSSIRGFSADALWQHSLRTASAAKIIAKTERASRTLADESFSAGMLHDTGKLILAANFPKQYGEALEKMATAQLSTCAAEREVFGCSHAEIGGYLLGLWGLPEPVVEAIALHHSPASSPNPGFTALTATCAANALVHVPEATAELEPYLTKLGLNQRLPIWRDAMQENVSNGGQAI
jgi:HD-like signal output (HDOD) protein